jgi:hypothetical protein
VTCSAGLKFLLKTNSAKYLRLLTRLVCKVHYSRASSPVDGQLGGILTVIYTAQSDVPQKKTTGVLLPMLVILFLFSYGILTFLVIEQGRTIDAQRGLLREMLKDSTQLAALKSKMAQSNARSQETAAQQSGPKSAPAGEAAGASPKAPSKDAKRPSKSARKTKEVPQAPAADLQDVRRSTRVI